ncbi:MAG: hydrogenase iron-sulfur subunit [Rhodospirillaceae bacterium]|jgi:quinol-cytochrome oxidoreductase complex cytochrome b subunit/coenzyme F420-reducing hydrogenase delta subunit|nr:hydrogenase iron-sulfur subunit [Rhodospirillaceae bacterium]MBT5014710.1 hydrogenase iron-sulfur subunit [Rhodospirillaceae bacterium]MBT5308710.1 hydrogenase iron-sulfur subunit [Rhodospirillaceae bacterium]MBT7356649.1 hydrogenase iron-sulfur subunit [Rhodospirillaceae bacterium]
MHLEAAFDVPFGASWNPLRQMGTLTFFYFWIVAVTGIYVYILFDTTVGGAYRSVEEMTNQQWYLGGIMRSIHRYASDAMVVTMVLHLSREFIMDRYRDVRWFTWFTGTPLIWFLFISGISGYWLVWDELAQYVAIGSMEWLDWLGIFGEPVANNFLDPGSLTDRFFTLLVFMHIFAPLFLLFIMWIHVMRVTQPKVNPPRGLAIGSLAMFVVLALIKPAVSHAPADLAMTPTTLNLDWFYMMLYPAFDTLGAGTLWVLAVGLSCIVCAMPWIPPLKRPRPAEVDLTKCNGCTRCFTDCPFGAVTMQPRSDGAAFDREAVVDPDMCTGCGICVGSCPVSTPFRHDEELMTGIDLPDFDLTLIRKKTLKAAEKAGPNGVLVFGCDYGADVKSLKDDGIGTLSLPCIGMLPPSFIDFSISRAGVAGVMISGCKECDCFSRLGNRWTQERIAGVRDPYLRKRVDRARITEFWGARIDADALADAVREFRATLGDTADDEEDVA